MSLENIFLRFVIRLVNKKAFSKGKYEKVLKAFPQLLDFFGLPMACRNSMRVAALFHTQAPEAFTELAWLVHNKFGFISSDDQEYLRRYFDVLSQGYLRHLRSYEPLDLDRVSKLLKEYFPFEEQIFSEPEPVEAEKVEMDMSDYIHFPIDMTPAEVKFGHREDLTKDRQIATTACAQSMKLR